VRRSPQERVREEWPRSKESGNPYFQGRGWVFVALPPNPEDKLPDYEPPWRLWVKQQRQRNGYVARGRYPSFEALRQTVAELLPMLPV
jgi:hypothetical protein